MNKLTESSIIKKHTTLDNGFYLEYRWSSPNIWEVVGGFDSGTGVIQTTLYKTFATEEQAKRAYEKYKKQYASDEDLTEELHNSKLDEIKQYIDDLYAMRKDSLAKDGEYSTGNLVFKELRNKGYLDNLKDLKNKLIGKELSLKEGLYLANKNKLKEDYSVDKNISLKADDKEVGKAITRDYQDGEIFLTDFEIKPEFRGKGYGTSKFKELVDKYGVNSLSVNPNNTIALNMYKKFGFKQVGDPYFDKNANETVIYMKKSTNESLVEAGINTEALAKEEYKKIVARLNNLYARQDELGDDWDRADNNPWEQTNIGNSLDEISKKIEAVEKEKQELIKNWGYCLDLDTSDTDLTEEFTMQDIYSYKREIQKYTHFEPIIQHSGRFDFYNLRESDADSIIRQLRGKDFIEYIQKTPGRYNFASAGRNMGMPTRYYNVFGFIKNKIN